MAGNTVNPILVLGGVLGALALVEQTIDYASEMSIDLEQYLVDEMPDLELSKMACDEYASTIESFQPPIPLALTLALRQCQKTADRLSHGLWRVLLSSISDTGQIEQDNLRKFVEIVKRDLSKTASEDAPDQPNHLQGLARALQQDVISLGTLVQM